MDLFTEQRKFLSKKQTALRTLLTKSTDFETAKAALLAQHACLHSSMVTNTNPIYSLEDLLLNDLPEETYRHIPNNQEHSIAWNIWHLARIEDCTMNTLIAGESTVFESGNWKGSLNINIIDTGNAMICDEIRDLSMRIEISALRAYRQAVGKKTQNFIKHIREDELDKKVDPLRLQVLIGKGCVRPEAQGLIDYWAKRTYAGLFLMPATRHNIVHLNEAYQLKQRKE